MLPFHTENTMKNLKLHRSSVVYALLKVLIGFTMVNVVFLIFYTHSTFTSFIRFDNTYKHDTNVEERQNHKWVAVDFEGNLLENEKIRRKQYLKVQNRSQSNRRKSFMTGYSTNIGKQVIIVKGNGSQKDRLKEYINEVKSQRIKTLQKKKRISWKSLTEALDEYIDEVKSQRIKTLQRKKMINLKDLTEAVNVLAGDSKYFLQKVSSLEIAKIIVLPWLNVSLKNEKESRNLLLEKFYSWYGSSHLCKYLTTSRNDDFYWETCTSNISETLNPREVENRYLNQRFWILQEEKDPKTNPEYVTFILLIEGGLVTSQGVIFTGKYKVVPFPKFVEIAMKDTVGNISSTPEYQEVFVITQVFSMNFYHRNIELFPKLAVYLNFLKENPEIKIHIGKASINQHWKAMIGLDSKRYLYGSVKAHILYVPEPNYTGHTNPLPIQMLSKLFRTEIHKRYGYKKRDVIILINRSNSRVLKQRMTVRSYLSDIASQYNVTLVEFNDNPVMSYKDSMKLFNRALLVVGPQGAGFTNLLYSEPGVFVIEALCETPKSFLYYQSMTYALGHHYYGITAVGNSCPDLIDIDTKEIQTLLNYISSYLLIK